tara:strand:- start:1737 stop:2417 length:681 start_codon:yes stop_codon:yes gene_type:complete
MALIPPNNYPLNKLIEKIVELKYGKDTIAKQTNQNSMKGMVVIRAGKKTPVEKDDQRWKEAREAILNAIFVERLKAYVSSEKGREMYIVSDEWELRENPKFEDHQVELTLYDGKLTWKAKPEFDGQPVYFRTNEKDSFLDMLTGASQKKSSGKKKNGRHTVSEEHKEEARKVAKNLWEADKTITIADMGRHDAINKIAPNYSEATYRKWLKDLAPSNSPGRRPQKK